MEVEAQFLIVNLMDMPKSDATNSGGDNGKDTTPKILTPKPSTQQSVSITAEPTLDPEKKPIVLVKEVNDYLFRLDEAEEIGGSNVQEILVHDLKPGHLYLKVWQSTGQTS